MTDIARERAFLSAQGLDIIPRETWGAVQTYTSTRDVFEPVEGFVLHISVTLDHGDLTGDEHGDMRTIERIGQERFGIGFPYNAAVFDTGRLYEGQPLTRRGAHTVDDKNIGLKSTGTSRSMNFWWRAIVLPQMVDDDVTDAQVDQCARWAAAQIRNGYAKRNFIWIGHRDVAWKGCPGDTGYARLPQIRALTTHYVNAGLGPGQEDDVSTEEVITHINNTVRPFLVAAPTPDGAVFVDNRDGTKTWVKSQEQLRAVRLDGVNHAGTQSDGVTPTPFTNRTEEHLRSLTTVGPVPPGWE